MSHVRTVYYSGETFKGENFLEFCSLRATRESHSVIHDLAHFILKVSPLNVSHSIIMVMHESFLPTYIGTYGLPYLQVWLSPEVFRHPPSV